MFEKWFADTLSLLTYPLLVRQIAQLLTSFDEQHPDMYDDGGGLGRCGIKAYDAVSFPALQQKASMLG